MHHSKEDSMNADQALKELAAGNKRFAASGQLYPNQSHQRMTELSDAQKPFAAILGCSDSRVPPEVIFDRGLGDLFVVRVAGHVMNDFVLGSIEYAADHLQTPLIMVLGHSKCGAVQAAASGAVGAGHTACLTESIQPALEEARKRGGDLVDGAAKANAKIIAKQLKASEPILCTLVGEGKLKIVPAFYDLDTGLVEILSD